MQLSNYLSLPARFRLLKPKQKRLVRLGCAALALTLSVGAVSFLTTRASDDVVTNSDVNVSDVNVVTKSDAEKSMFFSRSAEPKLTRSSIVEEGSCGDNATYTIDSNGLLTVSGSGAINREAFNNKTNITAVSFGSGITTVNAFAFKGCTGLTSVTFPSSITTIQMAAFYGCSGLQSVTFNGNVTAMGNSAFVQCNNLNALTIEGMSFEGAEFQYLQTGTVVTLTKGFTFDGIEVTQDNAGSYFGNATVNFRVPVTGVTLNKNSMTLPIGSSETLTATILPQDATNQNVTWSSSNTNVATVDQNGKVTVNKKGRATITATTEDGAFTAACEVTVTVPVTGIYLKRSNGYLRKGHTRNYSDYVAVEPGYADNQNVTWSSSDTSVATVDQSGNVTLVEEGTATITVTTVDGGYQASFELGVYIPPTSVSLNKSSMDLYVDEIQTLTATVEPENAACLIDWCIEADYCPKDIYYAADITGNGRSCAVRGITASGIINTNYIIVVLYLLDPETMEPLLTDSCYVKVYDLAAGITLNKNELNLNKGESETLTATVETDDWYGNPNPNVTWSSSNANVAAVDQNGTVTAVDRGTATITATTADGGFTASCQVTVAVPVTGVTLNKDELKLHTGNSETLTATLVPQNANNQNVTWSSSDPSVATVDQSGKVTAAGVGTASVTVTTEEGSFTASCQVTVVVPVTGVTLDKSELRLLKSESVTLTATVEPEDATDRKVTWSSSDTNVANVDQSGKVTAKNAGSATITATTEDGAFTAACEVTVKESTYIVQSESVLDWTKGSGKDMTVVIKNAENDEETHLKFTALYVDDAAEAVAPSNYETAKGSLRLTLKASYLETLSVGKHALTVEFKDGSVKQSFTVHAASVGSNSPGTGESNIFLMLCVILLAVSGACGAFVVIRRKISRA